MSELKRLEQATIEDKFSKANLVEFMSKHVNTRIPHKISHLEDMLVEYSISPSWESKERRVAQLLRKNLFILAQDVALILVPLEGSHPIQSVAAKVAAHLGYDDPWDGIKTASEIITLACDIDMCDIDMPSCSETGSLIVKSRYTLPHEVKSRLSQAKYLPPMICQPNEVKHNYSWGNPSNNSDPIILGKYCHNKKVCLDVINTQNRIPLSIDMDVYGEEELPTKPLDTPEKIRNFNQMKKESKEVYADLLEQDNEFYLTHKYDSRGRMYSQGYHVNYQGTSYKRALISLRNKELVV